MTPSSWWLPQHPGVRRLVGSLVPCVPAPPTRGSTLRVGLTGDRSIRDSHRLIRAVVQDAVDRVATYVRRPPARVLHHFPDQEPVAPAVTGRGDPGPGPLPRQLHATNVRSLAAGGQR